MSDYKAKRTMYRIAKPIINVFLSNKSEDERREVLRKVV